MYCCAQTLTALLTLMASPGTKCWHTTTKFLELYNVTTSCRAVTVLCRAVTMLCRAVTVLCRAVAVLCRAVTVLCRAVTVL
jgi:hypothetical protein